MSAAYRAHYCCTPSRHRRGTASVNVSVVILVLVVVVGTTMSRRGRKQESGNNRRDLSPNFQLVKCVETWLRHIIAFYKERAAY